MTLLHELSGAELDMAIAQRKSPHYVAVWQMLSRIRQIGAGTVPPLPTTPQAPDSKMILAQGKLILEEVLELFEACGLVIVPSGTPDAAISSNAVRRGSVELKLDPGAEPLDLPHIAKEIADVSVVNTGMFVEFGMSDLALLEEVDMNNLAKFGPGGFLGPDRKWQKPPKHPKPDLASVLKLQGWEQPETSRETHTTNTSVSG